MSSGSLRMSTRKKKSIAAICDGNIVVRCISDVDVEKVIIEGILSPAVKTSQENATQLIETRSKSSIKQKGQKKEEETDVEVEHDYDSNGLHEKPIGLCDEDDVAGEIMYAFQTPKKKQGMIQKAIESAGKIKTNSGTPKRTRAVSRSETPGRVLTPRHKSTPTRESVRTPSARHTPKKTSGTPRVAREVKPPEVVIPKTPYALRARQKRAIQACKRQLQADTSDFEDSDYDSTDESSGEKDDSSPEQDEDSSSDSGKGSEEAKPICRRSLCFPQLPTLPTSRKRDKDLNYVFTADEYFNHHSSKSTTSDHNLGRLRTPRLDCAALQSLLTNCSMSEAHQQILTDRRANDLSMFQRWMFALSQGFSVLAYGLGSKYKILQSFHRQMLSNSHVLVVNGFFPSLGIKEIVETIGKDLLGLKQVLPSPHAVIDWIESRRRMPRVFLIIHNLDAEMLRCEKTQLILARLASLPKVHLVASIDHINCPLLWDQAKLSAFNFMWEDTTSFLPYQEETSYETSLMVQNSGSLALSSLLNVYRSLTHNSRGVFRIILEKHLGEDNQKYAGMAFSSLYSRCREEMLVTSDLALRTMLTEFLDHQMVKWRRDGEHLHIPTDINVLRQFHKVIQDS